MDRLTKVVIEEIALEGSHGMPWAKITERIAARLSEDKSIPTGELLLGQIQKVLLSDNVIEETRSGIFNLISEKLRYQVLGISQLPIVYENPQAMKILEIVARGRQRGAWSFSICSALKCDPKQLFHLSNILVEFGLLLRFSNVTIPRSLKSHTSATNASFFVLSKFSNNSMDPDIADVVDPTHSTDNVCSLLLALLREAGGVMISKALRTAVVIEGGFTGKQYKRGRTRLVTTRRIETILVPKQDEDMDEDEEDFDEDDEKVDNSKSGKFVQAIKLVEDHEKVVNIPPESPVKAEDEEVLGTPPESEEDDQSSVPPESVAQSMLTRNLIRASVPFRESIMLIISASGTAGVTTKDLSRLTGIGGKEILKTMESIRASDRVEAVWKNDGKRKYIVYRAARPKLTIKVEGDAPTLPTPPASGKGYVTDQTVRRSTIASEIVSARIALSLIDLGRAIEAREVALGVGIPGAQIDRRTLKKICEIAKIPLVEKGESSNTKLIIAFDPLQVSQTEAMRRVDRPVGITPKSTDVKMLPASTPSTPVGPVTKLNVAELLSKGRLAALAVFGKSERPAAPSVQIAELYGFIRSSEIFRAKLIHQFLLSHFEFGCAIKANELMEKIPLLLFLQVVGCGVAHPFIDDFISSKSAATDLTVGGVPSEVSVHLKSSAVSQLARAMAPLVKLGLVEVEKIENDAVYYKVVSYGRIPSLELAGEPQVINFTEPDKGDEFWSVLFRTCMAWRAQHGSGVFPKSFPTLPQLFKLQQWKSRMVVTLAQRRELELLLRKFTNSPHPVVVDGSNEDLIEVCARANLERVTALKVLKQLQHLASKGDASNSVIFATVNQARFKCPTCGQLFYQLSSIQRHIDVVHHLPVPADIAEFTRPEYTHAIEKLQAKSENDRSGKRSRRRRRREVRHETSVKDDVDDQASAFVDLAEVEKYVNAFGLAKRLAQVGGEGVDVELVDPTHAVWAVAAQLIGDPEDSVEMTRIKLIAALRRRRGGVRVTAPSLVALADAPSAGVQVVSNLLCMNKLAESDYLQIEAICKCNGVDFFQVLNRLTEMHSAGLLAIERRVASAAVNPGVKRTYCLSRSEKINMFGKFGEISKLLKIINSELFQFRHHNEDLVLDAEPDYDSVVAFSVLDRLGNDVLLFDWEESMGLDTTGDDDIAEGEDGGEDMGFTGIKKHIELTQDTVIGGSIERVEVITTPTPSGLAVTHFMTQLIRMGANRNSFVWRPVPPAESEMELTGDEMPFVNPVASLQDLKFAMGAESVDNAIIHQIVTSLAVTKMGSIAGLATVFGIDLETASAVVDMLECLQLVTTGSDGQVYFHSEVNPEVVTVARDLAADQPPSVSKFTSLLFAHSPSFAYSYAKSWANLRDLWSELGVIDHAPSALTTPLAAWTSIDGDVKEQMIADLLIHLLYIVYSVPGVTIGRIFEMLVIVPVREIRMLMEVLISLEIVHEVGGEFQLKPLSQW